MVRLVQSAIKSALPVLLLVMILGPAPKPGRFILVNAVQERNDLVQQAGFLKYKGENFSGLLFTLFANADTASTIVYRDGKEHGCLKKYYSKNRLSEQRFFINGEKAGVHEGWYPDGKIRFRLNFLHGEYEGECAEWFPDGKIYRKFHYTKGYENGLQQMWWPDGSVRANYVVRNGEQFGLIGRKLCVNPVHEKN